MSLREDIKSLQYALLSSDFRRESSDEGYAYEVLRLGLVVYLVTLINEFPHGKTTWGTLGEKLRAALEKTRPDDGIKTECVL